MNMFKDILKDGESLFKNEIALDYDFLPKLIPYREGHQRHVAGCIKPLLAGRNGRNVFIYGAPGIGKTAAVRHILRELEDETDEVYSVYINCWQKNTSYKVIVEICNSLGYRLTLNKKTDELFDILKNIINKKAAVFAFDEIDKLEDLDFIYMILEGIYKKSVILITNYKEWLDDLDERIKSRLYSDMLEFKPYNLTETRGILKQRMEYAFAPNAWNDEAFEVIVKKAAEIEDIRAGLHLMKEAGMNAESRASRKIELKDAEAASTKLDEFSIKRSNDLTEEEKNILEIVKLNSGKKIGDMYNAYKDAGGSLVYKSFQRKVDRLGKSKFVNIEKKMGGKDGTTSIISYKSTKTLNEF